MFCQSVAFRFGRYSKTLWKIVSRKQHTVRNDFNQPLSANDCPRAGGIATFMRLPHSQTPLDVDVGIIGIPFDNGTSNRPGARFGPRQIRCESSLLRPYNAITGISPFNSLQVADLGDIPVTIYDINQAMDDIQSFTRNVLSHNCIPVSIGGDHTITYPILKAIKEKHGPVSLLHIDAHADVNPVMMGCPIAHGTPFYRATEEGCLQEHRVVQIGLRGTTYGNKEREWSLKKGFHIIPAHECWHLSLKEMMLTRVREVFEDSPLYITLDIDSIDPAFAPGTGTPEIGGLTTIQVLEIIRGCEGLNIIGADLVEVSPPYDPSGNTALTAANLLFEILCVLPGVRK